MTNIFFDNIVKKKAEMEHNLQILLQDLVRYEAYLFKVIAQFREEDSSLYPKLNFAKRVCCLPFHT